MKTLGQQVLVLGGFYFIISFLSSLGSGNIFEIFDLIMFITFICLLIILCCKRRYNFLINFQNRFRKIFNYLLGLGIVQYFETIFVNIINRNSTILHIANDYPHIRKFKQLNTL